MRDGDDDVLQIPRNVPDSRNPSSQENHGNPQRDRGWYSTNKGKERDLKLKEDAEKDPTKMAETEENAPRVESNIERYRNKTFYHYEKEWSYMASENGA